MVSGIKSWIHKDIRINMVKITSFYKTTLLLYDGDLRSNPILNFLIIVDRRRWNVIIKLQGGRLVMIYSGKRNFLVWTLNFTVR